MYYNIYRWMLIQTLKSLSFLFSQKPNGIKTTKDLYHSLHLSLTQPIAQQTFGQYLKELVKQQRDRNAHVEPGNETNAIWVHLEHPNLSHVGFLCQHGFKIHRGLGEKVVMCQWITDNGELSPPFSNFYFSCGAIIIHQQRILLVQEKLGPRKGEYGIPGGTADVGESIEQCCERQLWEQTGIKAKFKSIVYMRQFPIALKSQTDIYFACLMDFEPEALKSINICSRELSDHKWVDVKDYLRFSSENAWSTQKQVGRYLAPLLEKGLHKQANPGSTIRHSEYRFIGGQVAESIEHHLIHLE